MFNCLDRYCHAYCLLSFPCRSCTPAAIEARGVFVADAEAAAGVGRAPGVLLFVWAVACCAAACASRSRWTVSRHAYSCRDESLASMVGGNDLAADGFGCVRPVVSARRDERLA